MRKERKKEHKKIIKYMRLRNRQLASDDYIGLNRFRIDMYQECWKKYDDNSGGYLHLIFKMTDKVTDNTAFFVCDNYDCAWKMFNYLNDFLIRCSSGQSGHYPPLHYVAYDIHTIQPYSGGRHRGVKLEDGVIDTYSYLSCVKYEGGKI